MSERLQKVLARAGLGSRRRCEELILEGRVEVNGEPVLRVGVRVDPARDDIRFDGEPIRLEQPVHFLLHKPRGYVCTLRPRRHEKAAVDLVRPPHGERLFTVGRLDRDSTGAILVTNDGDLAQLVGHPRYGIPKTYRVVVRGRADQQALAKVRKGVWLAEGRTQPAVVHVVKRAREFSLLKVTIREGRNRHLRRVFAKVGLPVVDLCRVAIGPVHLGRLEPGAYRPLTPEEIEALRRACGASG